MSDVTDVPTDATPAKAKRKSVTLPTRPNALAEAIVLAREPNDSARAKARKSPQFGTRVAAEGKQVRNFLRACAGGASNRESGRGASWELMPAHARVVFDVRTGRMPRDKGVDVLAPALNPSLARKRTRKAKSA